MLGKLLSAIANFFSAIFGGDSDTTNKPDPTSPSRPPSAPMPTPTTPTPTPGPTTPTEDIPVIPPPLPELPQDAAELPADSIIIVAHEMEEVNLEPGATDQDFDDNLFEDTDPTIPADETPTEPDPTVDPVEEPSPVPTPVPVPVPTRQQRYLWCLDNGHGQKTAGKRSPVFDDGVTQFFEYEFNRDIVARIIKELEKEGVAYFNVVPEVDIDNFLQGRVDRANRKASSLPKVFVSVHANAGPAQSSRHWAADSIKGIETWFYHGSNKGQRIASVFQRHLIQATGWRNRHLKSRPDRQFYVLRKTLMPAVLTENGFYNNKGEALELMKDEIRQQIADAHVAAILEMEQNGI